MTENNEISVAIIEDDNEIRKMLSLIIDGSPGYNCKQVYADCESSFGDIVNNPTDVVLMDIDLPDMNGIEGVAHLKEKLLETDFIMLTIKDDDESVFDSLCAGASGYLLKDIPPAQLLHSIKEVYEGGSPMSPSIARRIINSFRPTSNYTLTKRELEILDQLCNGENYNAIAELLHVSGHTVRTHIKNIYKKLHVNSRGEAVKKALRNRLV